MVSIWIYIMLKFLIVLFLFYLWFMFDSYTLHNWYSITFHPIQHLRTARDTWHCKHNSYKQFQQAAYINTQKRKIKREKGGDHAPQFSLSSFNRCPTYIIIQIESEVNIHFQNTTLLFNSRNTLQTLHSLLKYFSFYFNFLFVLLIYRKIFI